MAQRKPRTRVKRQRLTENDLRSGEHAGFVYLLHFDSPYHGKQHYMGFAHNPEARLREHLAGRGAKITAAAKDAGRDIVLARVWVGDRLFEADLKVRKINARVWCPICNPETCDPLHGAHVHETTPVDLHTLAKGA